MQNQCKSPNTNESIFELLYAAGMVHIHKHVNPVEISQIPSIYSCVNNATGEVSFPLRTHLTLTSPALLPAHGLAFLLAGEPPSPCGAE